MRWEWSKEFQVELIKPALLLYTSSSKSALNFVSNSQVHFLCVTYFQYKFFSSFLKKTPTRGRYFNVKYNPVQRITHSVVCNYPVSWQRRYNRALYYPEDVKHGLYELPHVQTKLLLGIPDRRGRLLIIVSAFTYFCIRHVVVSDCRKWWSVTSEWAPLV
jgi:hypothetical protein